ncbi:RidA family protein [Halorussus sp. MSC15.2]|uniref:RidA family protein n=1 Tax=Halorussus sp. MSC15.2 TaxID=2283638 RepID=UPI0013D7B945|nr:RidA family protein [Halorussus sp. MSC15.2]NEU55936.1 RidA family protein [Halorussus sp. MSC15.2]
MEKTVFRRENRGDDAVAATAVRTRHADHDRVQLDGVVGPGETPREQADSVLSFADKFLREYCDGRLADVTMIRHYVRADLLPEAETEIGEACRDHFDPPELPGTAMVGVSDVVGGDRAVKIEMEATIPHDRTEVEVVELPPPPGYVTSEDRTE